jgi:pilus assembly protein Flp/PilA
VQRNVQLLEKLANDEDGAALIEYTVLLGILVVTVIATIAAIGGWINTQWTTLNTNLNGH